VDPDPDPRLMKVDILLALSRIMIAQHYMIMKVNLYFMKTLKGLFVLKFPEPDLDELECRTRIRTENVRITGFQALSIISSTGTWE
jgi:hypothetical protein